MVHHQYPARHWTEHPALYKKHQPDYIKFKATMFRDTHVFELFFLMILKDYDQMADKFVDPSGSMSMEEKDALVKARLRCCLWGPNTTLPEEHNARMAAGTITDAADASAGAAVTSSPASPAEKKVSSKARSRTPTKKQL